MKLLLKIKYNGSSFAGYQFQPDSRTIQGSLTEAFSLALGFPINVTGCSRTDAGVHALGFCCTVEPKSRDNKIMIPVGKFHRAAERFLPSDISIIGEALVDDDFHARYFVKDKTYIYKISDQTALDPFLSGRAWFTRKPLYDAQIKKMELCGQKLIGRHDFTSFMASGSKIVDCVREISALSVKRSEDGLITLSVTADGFLYNMVRIITGTLLDAASDRFDESDIEGIISSKDRTKAGKTAPPDGLYLADVDYGRKIDWVIL